jgi:chromosome segregation ATPase
MLRERLLRRNRLKALLKASLLKPLNLFVLGVGFAAGTFSYILIPVGILAYGVLCYLDLSSEEFAKKVLSSREKRLNTVSKTEQKRRRSTPPSPPLLTTKELQTLRGKIFATKRRIEQLYQTTDDFMQRMMGDFSATEELVERSDQFLEKAQSIYNYLASEDTEQINADITALQQKIAQVSDDFSKRQYQQALDARYKHLETLRDIQQVYERLVSQLTNISLSLESMYSRMMKLKTSEYSLASAESDQLSAQLHAILEEMDQLDSAMNANLSLPD